MRSGYLMAVIGSIAACGGSACAMTSANEPGARCVVHGAEQLPADVGGAPAICSAIEQAIEGHDARVLVTIVNPHAVVATVTAGGRVLPEQRVDISDHKLNKQSIAMLARAVSLQLK